MYATSFRGTAETNKVLRNTFLLLALTMIPTVFGSWAGFEMGLPAMMAESPWISLFGFLAVAMVLLFAIHATAASALAIPILGVFTFVMGANMSGILSAVLSLSNGADIIALAFMGTIGILIGCSGYAMTTKRDFSSLGGFLFGSLIALIVFGLANMFFQLSWLALVLAFVALVLFSVYLVYDVQRVVNGGETNYILATTSIYLNLVNIFVSLLQIFGVLSGDD
jgi:modulator of FtsH protease